MNGPTRSTQQELQQLRDLAQPFRYRVVLGPDEEAIMKGMHGQIEWYAFNGKTLVAFTEKEFDIVVEDDDLDLANFRSINALRAFVERKSKAAR